MSVSLGAYARSRCPDSESPISTPPAGEYSRPRRGGGGGGGRGAGGGPAGGGRLVAGELAGVAGLQARVEEDGRLVGDLVADDPGGRGVEVGGGLEAGEGGPQEVDGRGRRPARLVGEHEEGPAGEGGVGGE